MSEFKFYKDDTFTFVIRPWAKDFRNYYDQLKSVWESIALKNINNHSLPPLTDLSDDNAHVTVSRAVIENIQKASLVLADITLGLGNIYYEFGYAMALGKPFILFRRMNPEFDLKYLELVEQHFGVDEVKTLEDIIKRHQGVPSDLKDYIYINFEIDDPKLSDEIQKRVEGAINYSYNNIRTSYITEWQLRVYLGLRTQNPVNYAYLVYEREGDIISLMHILEVEKRELGTLFISIPSSVGEDDARQIVTYADEIQSYAVRYDIRISIVDLHCKALIADKNRFYIRNSTDEHWSLLKTDKTRVSYLKKYLNERCAFIDSERMLEHILKMREMLGHEDTLTYRNDGFNFDEYAKLWINDPHTMLEELKTKTDRNNIRKLLQDNITVNFQVFAAEYLRKTEYIAAYWPLNEEGIDLIRTDNGQIMTWVEALNNWVIKKRQEKEHANESDASSIPDKRGSKDEIHLIDRYFIIPPKEGGVVVVKGELKYQIKNEAYRKKLKNFLTYKFGIGRCAYKESIYFIVADKKVIESIFHRSGISIMNGNVIMFSKLAHNKIEGMKYSGILQYEDAWEGKTWDEKLLKFHYYKLHDDEDRPEKVKRLISEIDAVKQAQKTDAKVLTSRLPAIMTYEYFKENVLNC